MFSTDLLIFRINVPEILIFALKLIHFVSEVNFDECDAVMDGRYDFQRNTDLKKNLLFAFQTIHLINS